MLQIKIGGFRKSVFNRVGVIQILNVFMKNLILKNVFVVGILLTSAAVVNAQLPISFSGQGGYASPSGGHFENAAGEKMSKFGLGLDFDVLWHLEQMDNKLGVGLAYNTSFLFGADFSGGLNVGLYGLDLYGVKGQYRFFNSRVSPYAALSLGLSRFSTPEISMVDAAGNSTVISPAEHAFGFGIRPEVGIEFGSFILSAAYIVPMSYTVYGNSKSAGCFQINIGWRTTLFER